MEKSSRNILLNILWPAEKEDRFGMTWDSVNYDRLFILGWIVQFIPSVLPHSPSQTFILFISLLFLAAVCQNTLSSTLFHPHCSLSLTHSGHYVKRCGPLDGRQCNQLIKSCFDHQHQSVSAWRAPEAVVWFGWVPVTLAMTHVMWLGQVSLHQTVQGLAWTMLWIPAKHRFNTLGFLNN